MRKILVSLLLATTISTPALAQRGDRDRSERAERSEARQQRAEARQQRAERAREQRAARAERAERRDAPPPVRRGGPAAADRSTVQVAPPAAVREQVRTPVADSEPVRRGNVNRRGRPTLGGGDSPDSVANWRGQDRVPGSQRVDRVVERRDGRVTPPPGARPDRPAPPPATTAHRDGRGGDWRDRRGRDGRDGRDRDWRDGRDRDGEWRRDWRRDHRYDWRRWRDRNRSSFRLGFYFDPFGWNYQRYNVGWRLWPSYYSNRYWLNDPWTYRLPQAPWPYRWVRYHNDALLVNTMTGEVADVIYDMFW